MQFAQSHTQKSTEPQHLHTIQVVSSGSSLRGHKGNLDSQSLCFNLLSYTLPWIPTECCEDIVQGSCLQESRACHTLVSTFSGFSWGHGRRSYRDVPYTVVESAHSRQRSWTHHTSTRTNNNCMHSVVDCNVQVVDTRFTRKEKMKNIRCSNEEN